MWVIFFLVVNFDDDKLGAEIRYQRPRSKSIADATPAIQVEGKDEDTQKLKELYDIAIERVKSVDESFLAEARSAPGSRTKVITVTDLSWMYTFSCNKFFHLSSWSPSQWGQEKMLEKIIMMKWEFFILNLMNIVKKMEIVPFCCKSRRT